MPEPEAERAASLVERVWKATEKAGPLIKERRAELAAALGWLIDMARELGQQEEAKR